SIPVYDDVEVSLTLNQKRYLNKFIYESPFSDENVKLDIELKKGNSTLKQSMDVLLISSDSGRNNHRIDITVGIPVTSITKDTYVDAEIVVESSINGLTTVVHVAEDARIRGRGNSTQMFPKKPYRINFSEDTSIFGMPAARNYVLLAEFSDKSLMRNVITHKLSTLLSGIEYNVQTRYVDVYINDDYQGLYVLTEQIENHENKINIESIPGIYNTGFLIEMDQRFYENQEVDGFDWVLVRGIPYEIKAPDSDKNDFTTAHHDYIFEYMIATEIALQNKDNYEELIDVENWIDFFIIQELSKNVDVGWSSIFMYKRPGDKLKFGPLWDFDLAYGNADYIDYGVENWYGMRQYKNRLFMLMMDVPSIRNQYRNRLNEVIDLYVPQILDTVPILAESIRSQANSNFERWPILNQYVWPNPYEVQNARSFTAQTYVLKDYIEDRSIWLSQAIMTDNYNNGIFD
ncbi:MAG: CotH kinase family protein, partial [Acholeplasmataceae bacterium]|nr:CotH kinase family protein [Acholeplasmataceae bacterium]